MGNWVEDDSSFLFFSAPAEDAIDRIMMKVDGLEMVEKHVFPYDVWQGGPVEPVWVDQFVIVPPWVSIAPEAAMKIVIDPGVVFGNCLHPTTRDCLRALSLAAGRDRLGQVLDLGTGTGVLSVAASMLGADYVTAVDLNPLCVKTAEKNVMLNGLDNIRVVEGDARVFAREPADLVVVNIHHSVMKDILAANVSRKHLRLIASGLMRTQAGEVKDFLRNAGFTMVREWDDGMIWYTLLAERGV